MKCCGVERTTPFCPACGKRLAHEGSLESLLAYCQERLSRAKYESRITYSRQVRNDRIARRVMQWEAWCAELERVIAERMGGEA